jgi:hypothetical protein
MKHWWSRAGANGGTEMDEWDPVGVQDIPYAADEYDHAATKTAVV